jgi:hypothetical protein
VILAKHLDQLVRRRFAAAIELRQPFFARCHLVFLHLRGAVTIGFRAP